MSTEAISIEQDGPRRSFTRAQVSWALFEFARSPYVSLIFMFVFAPYFASAFVGDPVRGQELWSLANAVGSFCVAFTAPILGAIVDRLGRRKPWIIGSVVVMAPCCWLLWYAMPGAQGGIPIIAVTILLGILTFAFQTGEMAANSMLPTIARPLEVGRVSGLSCGVGNIGTVTTMTIMLFGIALPASPDVNWSFLPDDPLFGLDATTFEHARISGPIAALWMAGFMIPMLLWTPDRAGTGLTLLEAVRDGLRQLITTIQRVRQVSNVAMFLTGRMLYNDGMIAVQAYCGIYAAGTFGWDVATILVFALSISVFSILGGFFGGWLDDRVGSRRSILISVFATILGVIVSVSVTPNEIFFVPFDAQAHAPTWSFPYFRTWPELIFVLTYMLLATTVTAAIANSRAMMARIAPLSMMSQFFGLYALSGTATTFLGHSLVAVFTSMFQSQRVGFASTILLLVAGLFAVTYVREERSPELV
jgi:MFS transporter, UMF1 family